MKFHNHDFESRLHALIQGKLDSVEQKLKSENGASGVQTVLRNHWLNLCDNSRVRNISKRFRWDLWWAVPSEERNKLLREIYDAKFNDDHIDRSLHRFVKSLNLPFYPQEYDGK